MDEEKLLAVGLGDKDSEEPTVFFECNAEEFMSIGRIISKYPQNSNVSIFLGWETDEDNE